MPRRQLRKYLWCLGLFFSLSAGFYTPAAAVEANEMLSDPVLEQRAREISQHLKCPVCQNNTIDDSQADLAKDLRHLVRDRLRAGDTNDQVLDYISERYGTYVLLTPPFTKSTFFLWTAPLWFLLFGGFCWIFLRRQKTPPAQAPSLSAQEVDQLKKFHHEMMEK